MYKIVCVCEVRAAHPLAIFQPIVQMPLENEENNASGQQAPVPPTVIFQPEVSSPMYSTYSERNAIVYRYTTKDTQQLGGILCVCFSNWPPCCATL